MSPHRSLIVATGLEGERIAIEASSVVMVTQTLRRNRAGGIAENADGTASDGPTVIRLTVGEDVVVAETAAAVVNQMLWQSGYAEKVDDLETRGRLIDELSNTMKGRTV